MSLYTTLSIARQAISVAQLGMQVTAQNIANVNTEGYKRQRVEQVNVAQGLGVRVGDVARQLDFFAERRLNEVIPEASRSSELARTYKNLEDLFNEVANRGLDEEFQDFFQALHDLAADPAGSAARSTLRARGESIGQIFEFFYNQMQDQMETFDLQIDNAVSRINGLIEKIAQINKEIAQTPQNPVGRNELLNTRDQAIRDLGELVPVTVQEDEDGNFNLFIKNGLPLIVGTDSYRLDSVANGSNDLKRDIYWEASSGTRYEITDSFKSGQIGAALESRDVIIPEQMRRLDRIAAEFALIFNEQHRAGTGLDGVSGRNFFETLPVYTHIGKDPDGGAAVTNAVVTDETLLTLDDYEIRFTNPTTYELVNLTIGASSGPQAYTPGAAINFDGISVTIDNLSGPPAAGDFFTVNTTTLAARNLQLAADVQTSTDAIAAGFTDAPGDNENVLLLADLENRTVAAGGTRSFLDMYQSFIVDLGVATSAANLEDDSQDTQLSQTKNMVESVSGVNTDEEATFILTYQQAFNAASKVVQVTDEMLDTVINLVR